MAAFKVGDAVNVKSLKKNGVVTAVLKGETYRVQLGALEKVCRAADLAAADPKAEDNDQAWMDHIPRLDQKLTIRRDKSSPKAAETLDLHGKRVEEALSLVEDAVNRAILDKRDRLQIIHGIGSGRVKNAVHEYLAGLSVVEAFKLDEFNRGTTWVYF